MNRRTWPVFLSVCLLLGGTSALLAHFRTHQRLGRPAVKLAAVPVYDPEGRVVGTNSVALPERVLDLESSTGPITQKECDMLPRDTTFGRRIYRAPDGFEIMCNVILMGADRTSIHKPDYCLPGQGWSIDEAGKQQTEILIERPRAYRLPVMKWLTRAEQETPGGGKTPVRGVYVFWFVAEGEQTASQYRRQFWLSWDLLTQGVLQRWAYVSCFAVCPPGQEEATFERIRKFIMAAVPEFQVAPGETAAGSAAPPR